MLRKLGQVLLWAKFSHIYYLGYTLVLSLSSMLSLGKSQLETI